MNWPDLVDRDLVDEPVRQLGLERLAEEGVVDVLLLEPRGCAVAAAERADHVAVVV